MITGVVSKALKSKFSKHLIFQLLSVINFYRLNNLITYHLLMGIPKCKVVHVHNMLTTGCSPKGVRVENS